MESNNIEFEFVNLKKFPIKKSKLNSIADEVGMDSIFNMKGPTFRKMKLDYSALSRNKKLYLLFENQNMIKRPLIESNNKFMVGFNEQEILDFSKQN